MAITVVAEIEDFDTSPRTTQNGVPKSAVASDRASITGDADVNVNFVHRSAAETQSNVAEQVEEEAIDQGSSAENEAEKVSKEVETPVVMDNTENDDNNNNNNKEKEAAVAEEETEEEDKLEPSVQPETHPTDAKTTTVDVEPSIDEQPSNEYQLREVEERLRAEMDAVQAESAARVSALEKKLAESETARETAVKGNAQLERELQSRDDQLEKLQREMASHSSGVEKTAKLKNTIAERDKEISKLNDLLGQEQGFSFSFKMEIEELQKQLANAEHELSVLQDKVVFPLGTPQSSTNAVTIGNDNEIAGSLGSEQLSSSMGRLDRKTGIVEQLEEQVKQLETQLGEQARDFTKQIELLRDMLAKEEKQHEHTRELMDRAKKKLSDQINKLQNEKDQLSNKINTMKRDADLERKGTHEETERLRQSNTDLLRKFYWHALLSVKLKLQKNFSMAEMVDMAISEKVTEEELNGWIATKLGLRERDIL